ncbi:ring-opening amidohydrolase [Nocardia puris]|uniref:Cyanuric acid amidohydrolase n=1 Tax=Nocardia puris TaxID=208602 RepID=A0A366DMG5_9NOCA|nr:ring-opening amidohydrolase [Nocardia puris]MBF6211277.1 ring-opening amidohydrolase [Nocardia puris]MBF6364996.1 ring-opening amidohydrolase [Nocardia puris]MBF6458781.1 ring-opening amidohydrolase [Nocardia puris]RBO90629.1 cyanuric acid amidohydrolase [Nocardia puris]
MSAVTLFTVPTAGPDDLGALETMRANGFRSEDVVAVIGKTEGNGCVNDFSRTLSAAVWEPRLPGAAVTVFSGGTEGVLSPHVNVLVRDDRAHEGFDRGLVAAAGRTRVLVPAEIGGLAQVDAVADTVGKLLAELGAGPGEAHLVLVKCPLLTSETIAALRAAGHVPAAGDPYESMGKSRGASALGIAVALGECDRHTAEQALAGLAQVSSARASASAGAELDDCHVLVVAESTTASNPLRAIHGQMTDALDLASVRALLDEVAARGGTVRQIFAKAEADPTGAIRGLRHTMLTDSDINATRHARAAVGGLLAALKGDGAVYVSGGAEHQGPPGGGSLTVIYELPTRSRTA